MRCYDNELEKITMSRQSRLNRSDGFQGCANLGKGCDFTGFYLCRYSLEGLCDDCEIKQHPERYHGCASCGHAIQYKYLCTGCADGFGRWLFDVFYNKNDKSKTTTTIFDSSGENETNNWGLWHTIKGYVFVLSQKFVENNEIKPVIRNPIKPRFYGEWPGFRVDGVVGDTYTKLDPYEFRTTHNIVVGDLQKNLTPKELLDMLGTFGITPYSNVQYTNIL